MDSFCPETCQKLKVTLSFCKLPKGFRRAETIFFIQCLNLYVNLFICLRILNATEWNIWFQRCSTETSSFIKFLQYWNLGCPRILMVTATEIFWNLNFFIVSTSIYDWSWDTYCLQTVSAIETYWNVKFLHSFKLHKLFVYILFTKCFRNWNLLKLFFCFNKIFF